MEREGAKPQRIEALRLRGFAFIFCSQKVTSFAGIIPFSSFFSHSDKILSMDEIALITDAQNGSLDAFNTLVLHYQDSVFNTALRILGDEDQAADAAQEAFISAFKSIKSFRGGSF
ncbi:MAG: sigma factor, partial [Chloroflexota bacterium]